MKQSALPRPSFFLLLLVAAMNAVAQPVINAVNPMAAGIGATVTITGKNFDAVPANNIVYFGATRARVNTATAGSLSVTVPLGATYGRISLFVNTFTAYSPLAFTVVSGQTLTANSFTTKIDFTAGDYPEFIARGDLDGDGRPDMAVANFNSPSISVFRNTSSPGNVSFDAAVNYATGTNPEGILIDDINGDGQPDIVVTSIDNHLFSVFLNTSTSGNLSFAARTDNILGNLYWPRGIASGDIDGDGKTDIVTADNNKQYDFTNGGSYGTISVSRNNRSGNAVSFDAPKSFISGEYARSVFVTDMDGDGRPDVVSASNANSNLSVFHNNSTPGNINLVLQQTIALNGQGEQVVMGDLDGDGKPDLAVSTFVGAAAVNIFKNTSSAGNISFAPVTAIATGSPLGLSLGDLDGDGKPDLAAANYNTGKVTVLKNTSAAGKIAFAPAMDFNAGNALIDAKIGDVDGDNYPDLTVTSASANMVSVLRLAAGPPPPLPVIKLGNDTTICAGDAVVLSANASNAHFLWNTGETTNQLVITQTGTYWLQVTTLAGIVNSDSIHVTVSPRPHVFLGNDTLLCSGATKMLDAFTSSASYVWSNGSTGSSVTVTRAGNYAVAVNLQGCIQKDTIVIRYDSIPVFSLGADAVLCGSQTIVLNPGITGGQLQWQDGTSTPAFTVTQPGNYKLTVTNHCGTASDEINIVKGNCGLFVPNAFTPNADGANDLLKPVVYGQVSSFRFRVFNRFGQMIFQTTDPAFGWNGKMNGREPVAGVYVWDCSYQFQAGGSNYKKGTTVLIR